MLIRLIWEVVEDINPNKRRIPRLQAYIEMGVTEVVLNSKDDNEITLVQLW